MRNINLWGVAILFLLIGMACEEESDYSDPISDNPIDEPIEDPVADPSLTGIMKEQYEIDMEIYYKVKESGYTLDNPYVVVDPYGVAPLSAYVAFETEESVSVVVTIAEKGDLEPVSHSFIESDTLHFIPIYGLYQNADNNVTIKTSDGQESVITIETERVESASSATIVSANPSLMSKGLTMAIHAVDNTQTAFDAEGNLRVAFDEDYIGGGNNFFVAENGNFISSGGELTASPYYRTHVYEFNGMGKLLASYEVPGATHHDIREMPSGNLLVATNTTATSKSEDVIVEIDRTSGSIVKTWNIGDYVPVSSGTGLMETGEDWFHNNSVYYDEDEDQLIVSGRHRDIVIAIDYYEDKLNWMFGSPEGWDQSMLPYFFTPVNTLDFEWQWAQHSAIVTEEGDLFLFDNGNNRSKYESESIADRDNYSRAVIYGLDTDAMEATQRWEFGKSRGYDFYSSYISEVNYLDLDHYLIVSGAVSSASVSAPGNKPGNKPEKDPVDNGGETGVVVELIDDQIVFEMTTSVSTYRVERFETYSQKESQFLEKGAAY